MSFDPRSRERLESLGRSLPQKLPTPQSTNPSPVASSGAGRHRLETEQDPEALFRELMTASADGTVPSHLLERLRELETGRAHESNEWSRSGMQASLGSASSVRSAGSVGVPAGVPGPSRRANKPPRTSSPRRPRLDPEQQALYSDFDQLLRDADPDD